MKTFVTIVNELLALDTTKNIESIELQSDTEGSIEINVIYKDYDMISEELWDYTLSYNTEELHIDNFGVDQELPPSIRTLYRREAV